MAQRVNQPKRCPASTPAKRVSQRLGSQYCNKTAKGIGAIHDSQQSIGGAARVPPLARIVKGSAYTVTDMTQAAASQPLLEVTQLTKRYQGVTAVDSLSFTLQAGECLGVLGPNGAGKTTTLRMCLGHTTADEGEVHYRLHAPDDMLRMPTDASRIKASLGVVSQFDALDPDFSCEENIVVFGRYFGLRGADLQRRARDLLEFA